MSVQDRDYMRERTSNPAPFRDEQPVRPAVPRSRPENVRAVLIDERGRLLVVTEYGPTSPGPTPRRRGTLARARCGPRSPRPPPLRARAVRDALDRGG